LRKTFLIVSFILLVVLGLFGYRLLFPSDERKIQKLLSGLAKAASFQPNQGNLARIAKANSVANCFASDVQINLPGLNPQVAAINGRDEVMQMMATAQSVLQQAQVDFYDTTVTVEPGGEKALAHFVALAKINQDKDPVVQELKAGIVKRDGHWKIVALKGIQPLSSQVE
jgi:hypothetical protein